MKKPSLLVALAASAFALPVLSAQPANAPAGADAPRGVPFHILQRQLDKLRERVHALEAERPAGQVCPNGQFVTGFSSTGSILCAAPGGTPTPPAPPPQIVPIPDSAKAALQQALNGFAGQNLPLIAPVQTEQFLGGTFTYQPLNYDLAVGTIQITQPTATTAIIQVPIPNISVAIAARYQNSALPFDQSATIVASAAGVASVQVTIVITPSGARRVGSVTAVDLIPTSLNIAGAGAFGPVANFAIDLLENQLVAAAEQLLVGLINQLLPLLPDF